MRSLLRPFLCLGLLAGLPSVSAVAGEPAVAAPPPAAAPTDGIRRLTDVEYGRVGDTRLLLDLYLPAVAKDPVPVVIWVHGGAWVSGSKTMCPLLKLVPKGYAVASVGYRLATVAPYPAQIDDLRTAVRFLRTNAKTYGIDPARFGAAGASAGGHLVALLGTCDETGPDGAPSCRIQAVVDFFGPTDLVTLAGPAGEKGLPTPIDVLLGGPLRENREKAKAASPVTHVSKDDPPFLIFHGDRDWLVPLSQSETFEAALRQAGVEARLHVSPGAGHGRLGDVEKPIVEFFERHLKARPAADAVAPAAAAPAATAPTAPSTPAPPPPPEPRR